MQRLLPGAGHGISCFAVHPQLLAYAEKASSGGPQCVVVSWRLAVPGVMKLCCIRHQAAGMKNSQRKQSIQSTDLHWLSPVLSCPSIRRAAGMAATSLSTLRGLEGEVWAVSPTTTHSCAVQGPDAGIHVHSLQSLAAAGSAGISAAQGCQAVAFSPTGELLAVAEGQPSCTLALWDWQQVGHAAQAVPNWS